MFSLKRRLGIFQTSGTSCLRVRAQITSGHFQSGTNIYFHVPFTHQNKKKRLNFEIFQVNWFCYKISRTRFWHFHFIIFKVGNDNHWSQLLNQVSGNTANNVFDSVKVYFQAFSADPIPNYSSEFVQKSKVNQKRISWKNQIIKGRRRGSTYIKKMQIAKEINTCCNLIFFQNSRPCIWKLNYS